MPATLIKGVDLTPAQRAEVLRAYVYRWTFENARQSYRGKCPGCEQSTRSGLIITGPKEAPKIWTRAEWHAYHTPLISDDQWLRQHAFHFLADGSRLSHAQTHAETVYA